MPTRCLLIRNPASRSALRDEHLAALVALAEHSGWHVACATTSTPGEATELARFASKSIDAVVVNGGDGTINEVANGIAGSGVALGVLPGGTADVWARETRMPRRPLDAMRAIITGARRRVDLGRAGGRYFLLMAGVGLDARVVGRVRHDLKQRFGALAYLVAGAPSAVATKPWAANVTIDGREQETPLYWMVVGNTRLYGGFREITHRAVADDGMLDVALMHRGGLHLLADGARMLLRRHDRSPNVTYARARAIDVETPGIPVHVDGDYLGETPMRFSVAPRALEVIVPAGLRSGLFGS